MFPGRGDEYYPPRSPKPFVVDASGRERYARDAQGNEKYPQRLETPFARDAAGEGYYARDALGNEYYPVRNNRALFLHDPVRGGIRLALMADGTQRYPCDAKRNEYYWQDQGKPMLLRKNTGHVYLARSKNGHELIPWNHLQESVGPEPCVFSKDANGNTVYLRESDFPPPFKALIRCLCHISVICPRVTGCHTRFY